MKFTGTLLSCVLGQVAVSATSCDKPPTTSTAWVKGTRNPNVWYFSEKFSQDWQEFLSHRPRNFDAANAHCRKIYKNAHLAIPDTEDANDDLGDLISEYGLAKIIVGAQNLQEWITGHDIQHTQWFHGQPDKHHYNYHKDEMVVGEGVDCIALESFGGRFAGNYWFDVHCEDRFDFICQAVCGDEAEEAADEQLAESLGLGFGGMFGAGFLRSGGGLENVDIIESGDEILETIDLMEAHFIDETEIDIGYILSNHGCWCPLLMGDTENTFKGVPVSEVDKVCSRWNLCMRCSSLANECSYNTAAYGEFELETSYSVDSDLACEFGGEESKCSDSKCRCDTAAAEALMNLKEDLIRIAELPATQAVQCLPMALRSMSLMEDSEPVHESHHLAGKPDGCCIPENGDVTRGTIFSSSAGKQCVNGTLV